jgi:hypothetical protein
MGFLQIVTTSNYNAIANSHTQQFTTARTKSPQSAVFHRSLSGNGFQRRRFHSFYDQRLLSSLALAYLTIN